jgi:hypothetical protein
MTEQELQAIFEKLRAGVELTNEEMIGLARNSGYMAGQMKRLEVASADLAKNFKKAADELPTNIAKAAAGTANATGRLIKGLGEAETGFRQLNPIIDAAAKAFSGIPVFSGAVAAAAEASKFMINQLQNATDAFQDVAKVGGLTTRGISGLQEQFQASGMQLKSYTKTITANSAALANFAGSVGAGADQFSKTAGTVQKQFGVGLQRLGYGIDEIGETTASYIARQTRLGLAQGKSNEALAAGAKRYMLELDELTKLTGASKEEIKKEQDSQMSELIYRSHIEKVKASGDAKAIEEMEKHSQNVAAITKQFPGVAQAMKDGVTGFIGTSKASIDGALTFGGNLDKLNQSAKGDSASFLNNLRDAGKQALPLAAELGSVGVAFGIHTKELGDAAAMQIRDGKIIQKQQNDQTSGKGDKLTNDAVAAQKSMQEMSITIQKLGFEYMPAAASAVKSFTGSLQKLVDYVAKTVGGAPSINVGGGGGAGPKSPAAKRQALMDRRRQELEDAALTGDLGEGPAFSRPDTTKSEKVQLTLEEIRDELKKLVKLSGGGLPATAGAPRTGAPAAGAPTAAPTAPAAGGGAPAMTVVPPTSGKIGSVSEKWESGGRGSGVVGWDPGGGTSYGKYQIASKVGSTKAFLNFAEKSGRKDVAEKLRAAGFESDTGGTTGKAVDVWKEMAAKGELGDLEHQFIKSQSYDVAYKGLSPELQKRVEGSKALQEMLWSSAVHHGGGGKGTAGAAGIFGEVYKEGMSDEDLIKGVYANRGTRFGNQPENIRKSIQNIRFPQEQATILAMRQAEMAGGAAPVTTAEAPATPTAPITPTVPVSTALAAPVAPPATTAAMPAMTAGLVGQGQNVISGGLQTLTTALFGGGAQGAPGTAGAGAGLSGSEVVTLLSQLVALSRDQNSNLSKILSASTA